MSDRPNPFPHALLTAVIVIAAVTPVGYYGFTVLQGQMQNRQGAPDAAFVSLKAETLAKIRAVKTETLAEIKKVAAGLEAAGGDVKPALAELQRTVDSLRDAQGRMAGQLTRLTSKTITTLAKAAPVSNPMTDKTPGKTAKADAAHTIYFPKGVSRGPVVDKQVAKIMPDLRKNAAKRQCSLNVAGFADTLGNDDNNLKLSQRRADYVTAKLKAGGLKVSETRGWGERRLNVHTLDGADNEKNRRVVIRMNCATPVA